MTETQRAQTLPPALTSFVGRDADLTEVARLIAPGTLLTMTGAGGSGKTRLAVEAGRAHHGQVCFVPLASVEDPGLVSSAVAEALGLREEPGRPLSDVVVDHLRSRSLLLLLDNCEHVLTGVQVLVGRVLAEARGVALLATSREPLRVHGERLWPVTPLTVPHQEAGPDEVAGSSAGRLFLDRARQARPDFDLTADGAVTVAALCRQLGGLPLAIELIAPWTRALGVDEIAGRLDDLLHVPAKGGSEDRHRSIESALDWSVDLLTETQRTLFCRLSVFAGGFSLDAVESVADDAADEVLPTLAELVDKGLVTADLGAGGTRYRLLEPVRQYAARLLESSGQAQDARAAHLAYFVRLAESAERRLHDAEQVTWLARLDADHANLRVAFDRALDSSDPEPALRIAAALSWYWWLRGQVQEGAKRLERALAATRDRGGTRAKALLGLGSCLLITGPYDRAIHVVEESADLYRDLGHEPGLARAIGTLGRIEYNRGDLEASERLASQALEMYRRLDNTGGIAWMLLVLAGPVGTTGDHERYWRLIDEAAALFDERGDRWGTGWMEVLRGNRKLREGDAATAISHLGRALERFAEIGNRDEAVVDCHAYRAIAHLRLGDLASAQADALEAVELGLRSGDSTALAMALAAAAELTAARGDVREAAEIFGAAIALPKGRPYGMTEVFETIHTELRSRLDAAELDAALERGQRLPVHEVPDLLRADVPKRPVEPPAPADGVLVQEGDFWTVQLGSESTRVRDIKGLRYLAHLLGHPGKEFHVLDLVGEVERVPAAQVDRGDHGPLLDPQAKAAYRKRLRDLEEDLAEAESLGDDARAEHARTEREALAQELAGAVGLGGRDRPAGAASERARVNVTRLIGTALRKLEADCPSLTHLLRATVRTGTYCAYEPPPGGGPDWSLERTMFRPG